jgi:predicted RNA-binding protein associated with RNAse of E/G family
MTRRRIHPPKVEMFSPTTMLNIDPKGFTRKVDLFRTTSFGLFMARSVVDHPEFAYLRSWLLPELSIRISRWDRHPGLPVHFDRYLDIVEISHGPAGWRTTDLYLDITVLEGGRLRVLDADELTKALVNGMITAKQARTAIEATVTAVEGITENRHHADRWLARTGHPITWRDRRSH